MKAAETNVYNLLQSINIAHSGYINWLGVIFAFGLTWVVTWYLMPAVRSFALKESIGWADKPNSRRLNQKPLANAGGLTIYTAVIATVVVASLLGLIDFEAVSSKGLMILLGASILVLLGFIDDQFGLPATFRFWVQIISALLLIASGIVIEVGFGTPIDPLLSILLTLVWVVGITNAINLIDGMDGLAGGVSFIATMSLLAVAVASPSSAVATLLLAALGGAALGFLRHNFHPSKIILGDAGAYFFGYVLSATSIIGKLKLSTGFALIPLILLLLLPVLDTTQVFIRRLIAGKNPLTTPGKDHLHHHLLASGFGQRPVAIILWSVTLLSNCLGMKLLGMDSTTIYITLGSIMLLLGFTVWQSLRETDQNICPSYEQSYSILTQESNVLYPTPETLFPETLCKVAGKPSSPKPTSQVFENLKC
ncbi:MAG: undecaprenyl/decaprenyl-phosphate alpha-N-acetylglucosaminyl 1-phosphate transferase [Symploca sp. SIO2B6]|nr:undecaprenyl/decaprenyl-phosphate alpha-N-acetylglucosaminyl 1-phosphate transferase [Symploca sp. SIO2B6]